MKNVIILALLLGGSNILYGQKVKPDYLLEGGKIVLEALRIFKSSKLPPPPTNCTMSLCFDNHSNESLRILITQTFVSAKDTIELYSSPGGTDCTYSVQEGIYNYTVFSEGDIIRKAEVQLNSCDSFVLKLNE